MASKFFQICFEGLDSSVPPKPRSIDDNYLVCLNALFSLCTIDKR